MKLTRDSKRKKKNQVSSQELGFGNRSYSRTTRLIKEGGTFNVEKEGGRFWESMDVYHELISIKWSRFFLILSVIFLIANLLFAWLYYLSGPGSIGGDISENAWERFLKAFYFSTQTMTTVGFGRLNPRSDAVSTLAAIESFVGLLGFALATGLMYARFSRPRKRLIYSENALIAPYQDINALMFRFVHSGKNQLIEAEVQLVASMWDEAENRRVFQPLKLERSSISFFSTSWTVVHPLSEDSPLYGLSASDFDQQQVEIIVMFKAFDDTYARHIYDRTSYTEKEILFGKKFVSIYDHKDDDIIHIAMDRIGQYHDAALN